MESLINTTLEKQPFDYECLSKHKKPRYDFTLPGHNYLGPGTDIIGNLHRGVLPTDDADLLALNHDFEYLMANNTADIQRADIEFLANSSNAESVLSGLALSAKSLVGLDPLFLGDEQPSNFEKILLAKQKEAIVEHYQNEKTKMNLNDFLNNYTFVVKTSLPLHPS